MKMIARWAAALLSLALLSCLSVPATAQDTHATRSYVSDVNGRAPEQVCITWSGGSIGSGTLIPCGTGGGGGGGSNAAAAATGSAAGAYASQTGYVGSDGKVYNWVGDLLGHPAVSIYGTTTVSGTVAATQSGSWTIANTSFGISGSLPAFAATPTFNLGTGGPIGANTDAPATTTDTTSTSLIAQAKQAVVKLNALIAALGSPLQGGGTVAPISAASGKISEADVSLTTGTNTTLVSTASNRIGIKIQCNGGPVKVSETGATLTSAAIGTGPSGGIIPSANSAYTPLEASQTAYTAYQSTGSTVVCAVTDYRQ